ncbi:MAG: MBL fold metallo-hydrolase [Planctomycetota bacterium]|nr:MBL fold metallo-hydrolase [Planctomycetota bacterium]
MTDFSLEFHGAAQTVTGSMHLLHTPAGTVTMDCGLFQGRRVDAAKRNRHFPLPPDQLKGLLLSHAHIDHSGKIPALVHKGFAADIHATGATCDLCSIMLADSAHIQQEDARFWNEKRASGPKEHIKPLYTLEDAQAASKFFRPQAYGRPFEFINGCTATFLEAGHILGSACIFMELDRSGDGPVRLLYTGDLGRFEMPILRDPVCPLPKADYLITECTYANRRHHNPTDMKQRLTRIINETRSAGGKVIIPAFSVGRTQNVVYYLCQAIAEGLLEPLPIFVDSPLSTRATEVFKKHAECYDAEAREFWHSEGDIFGRGHVKYITDVEDSKRLNSSAEPCVIISASGMCEAGRILHHLKNNVTDERNTVVIVGFMAAYTLGRRIVERREEIKIFGRLSRMLCRVEILNGFSAHADAADFRRCFAPLAKGLKAAFVVHGEGAQPAAMKEILTDAGCENVHVPAPGDKFEL